MQRPRIPIWVEGGYPLPGPTRRALRWDGSFLYKAHVPGPDGEEAEEGRMTADDVGRLRAMAGNRPFDIVVGGAPRATDVDAERAHIRAVEKAGATWWVEWIPPGDRDTMRHSVDRGPLRGE